MNDHAYSESIHARYDWSNSAPSRAVVDAIASLEGVTPVDLSRKLDTTLHDYVDPDALDTLVSDGRPISISFTVADYEVRIDGAELRVRFD